MSQSHYLTCIDDNCEQFACVARRDYESKITELERKLKVAAQAIKDFPTGHNHWDSEGTHGQNCSICMAQYKHKREALAEIEGTK